MGIASRQRTPRRSGMDPAPCHCTSASSRYGANLWYFEVGNTLARKYPDDAAGHLSDLRAFRLTSVRPDSILEQQILHLTATYGVTFYDASYHALAIVKDGVFVTPDEKYLGKVTTVGHTLHLKDWPLT
jgi:predicted nucleic acid-binding protein